jgi:adenine-specific DNA-methyltransferase
MQVTEHELAGHAEFLNDSAFRLRSLPFDAGEAEIPLGLYELPRRSGEAHLYRLNHPLAEKVIELAQHRDLPAAEVRFDYSGRTGKVSLLEPLQGSAGWLTASRLCVEALDQAEDHLILAGITDMGAALDEEVLSRLLHLPGSVAAPQTPSDSITGALTAQTIDRQAAIQRSISERNAQFVVAESDKLDGWADDLKNGLDAEIKELERQIRETRKASVTALTLEEKLASQKQIRSLEGQRNDKRRSLFDAQDRVDKQRDELIQKIEGKLGQRVTLEPLFVLRWNLS